MASSSATGGPPSAATVVPDDLLPTDSKLTNREGQSTSLQELRDEKGVQAVLLYFSASWCGPCKEFTPKLVASYEKIQAENRPVECIFVSGCRSARDFQGYLQKMPFPAIPYEDNATRDRVLRAFGIKAYPSMVVWDIRTGAWFNLDARRAVAEDPSGEKLPWAEYKMPVFCLDKLKHTDPMPGPVWCERVFISLFLEGYLESTETQGGDKKRCGDVSALLQVHHFVAKNIVERRPEWLNVCQEGDLKAISEVNALVKKGIGLSQKLMKIKEPHHFAAFLKTFRTTLTDLKAGDEIIVPGGWQDTDSGHCIMHVLKRQPKDGFTFSIHNTGKGIKFHRSTASKPPGMKYETSMVFHNIPSDRVLDSGFWYMFFKLHVTKSDDHRHEVLYDVLYPHILGMPFARAVAQEAKNDPEPGTDFRAAQRAETCYYSSIGCMYDFLLAQHGLEGAKITQFRFAFMRAMVNMVHLDLQQVQSLNHSDARLVRVSAQQLALIASNENRAGRLQGASLAEILAKIEQIEGMVLRRAKYLDITTVPELEPEMDAKWTPLRGFRVYKRDESVEKMAGWQDAVPHNHLIDMTLLPKKAVTDSKGILGAIKTCLGLCKQLSRKHTSNTYFYVCSLIQQLFVEVLPLPIPPSERKVLKDCPWASMEISRKEYLEIISDLQTLSQYYTAASRSVQSNREFRGANVVVMACLMACLDSVVRIYTTDNPSTVAMVLNGTQHLFSGTKQRMRGPSAIKVIASDDELKAEFKKASENDNVIVVDFYAPSQKACTQIAPIYANMAKKYKDKPIVFIRLDAEKLRPVTQRYGVRAFPTFKFFFGERNVDTYTGGDPDRLEQLVKKYTTQVENNGLQEQVKPLIEADAEKVAQLMSFGYQKPAVEWALRACQNNMQVAAEKLMDTGPEHLVMMLAIEESSRKVIQDENAKILARNEERKKKIEERRKATGEGDGSSSSAADAAAASTAKDGQGEEKKEAEAFDREAAMKMLQPDFYLCTYDGYGMHIDELTNIALLLEPALAVARGKMLRYFLAQERLGKKAVFNFKTRHNCTTFLSKNSPTMELVKTLCNVMGYDLQPKDEEEKTMDDGISFIEAATWYLTHPKSPFAKEHPELIALRDVALLFRVLVTGTSHRRHVKLQRWTISHAQIGWKIKEPGGVNNAKTQVDLNASCFNQEFVCIETKPVRSPADPGIWIKKGVSLEAVSEDDVLHKRQLPTFDNALSQEDSEYLLSALTAPYMRIPLVVNFFASKDRVSALLNAELQKLFQSVLFEPMRWTASFAPDIRYVPAKNEELIGSPCGLLLNELTHAPDVVLQSLVKLVTDALELNTGSYTSSSASIILFLIRMLSGVHRYLTYLLCDDPEKELTADQKQRLRNHGAKIREVLVEKTRPILVQWEQQAQQRNDLRSCCVMNAHLGVLYRGLSPEDMSLGTVQPMMAYLAFLQTWHSPGLGQGALEEEKKRRLREMKEDEKKRKKSKEEVEAERKLVETPLLVPEHVYFDMLNVHRNGLVGWFSKAKPTEVDQVMQSILRVATRNQTLQSSGWKPRPNEAVGVFFGEKEEIEINVQSVELYFRNSHIEPVPNHMARTDDFALIFGKEPQHCALVAAHEHRQWVRLVGRSYNIRRWDEPDAKLTMVNMPEMITGGNRGFRWLRKEYTRPFPSDQIRPEEMWIVKVLEPAILSQFGQWKKVPYVKDKRFFMSRDPVSENAYSTCVIAFDKGTWRIFKVIKHLKVCFMYVLLEHGRRMYPSLAYTSDTRLCYYSLEPDKSDRGSPYHPLLRHAAGKITGKVPLRDSVVISRDVAKDDIEETFTPERLLRGLVPAAMTENFFFWQRDKDDHLVGYPKELNHPDFQYKLRVRLIDFKTSSLSGVITRSPLTRADISANTEISAKNFFDVKMQLAKDDPMVVAMNNSKIEVIVSQGYPRHIAQQVMEQFKYDLPVAQSWLANPKNQEMLEKMKADLAIVSSPKARREGEDTEGEETMELDDAVDEIDIPKLIRSNSQKDQHMLVLFDLLSVPKDSMLDRLVKVLTRVEDLGHILVWTDSIVKDYNDLCRVSRVELPRLKLTFLPRRDSSGKIRLYSRDHSDLFISDFRNERLDALSTGIPHCLLMENASREIFLLVPNCPVHRPYISRCPLSTELQLDRRDPEWMGNMPSRFYLYPVHNSHTFLVTPTLSSAVYLILMRMMSRQYKLAFQVVQSCEADRKLTQDEAWVFKQLRNANRDKHPNAHAVRLKFSLVIMHSGQNIEELWELQSEFKQYIFKIDEVSSDCRLSMDEEILLLEHIRSCNEFAHYEKVENQLDIQRGALDAELSNRHNYIAMLLSGRGQGEGGTEAKEKEHKEQFTHGQNDIQFGESTIWGKVERQIDSFYQGFDVKYRTWRAQCEYYRPQMGRLRTGRAIDLLNEMWKDQVTGVVRQLGFYFVAELLMERVQIFLVDSGRSSSKTLGMLFARILLLKNMQWGGRANLELKSSYNDNSWYPYVILGLLQHWDRAKHGDMPTLSHYQMDQLSEGMQTHNFGGLSWLGRHLNDFVTKLQTVQSSGERIRALHYPACNPEIISRIPIPEYATVKPLPQVIDFGCSSRTLEPCEEKVENGSGDLIKLDKTDCEWMRTTPLGPIGISDFVKVVEKSKDLAGTMPFDLTGHEAADSHVARQMLKRLEKDIRLHADMENGKKVPGIIGLMEKDLEPIVADLPDSKTLGVMCANGIDRLGKLVTKLLELRQADAQQIDLLAHTIVEMANDVPVSGDREVLVGGPVGDCMDVKTEGEESWSSIIAKAAGPGSASSVDKKEVRPTAEELSSFDTQADRYLFLLQRCAQRETRVWLEYLTASILSRDAFAEMKRLNPFLSKERAEKILRLTIGFLVRVNRVGCVDRCLSRALKLSRQLEKHSRSFATMPMDERKELQKILGHQASELARLVVAERYCMGSKAAEKSQPTEFDPRYLAFEYLYNILLRRKQVVLINTFLQANKKNESLVRQMIMGAGKSTVVAPMLSLILADGNSLVTLVVPTSLLEMSRNVMRARFTRVIPKRVHTFSFDRSCVWVSEVRKMHSKLKDARATKGVVVTTSESIKSLMLKHIELLDALRCAPPQLTKIGEKRLRIKSVMADEIARIMRVWSSNGVLILDEVDLLLHPLRSELNFPIGPKKPLDLSPHRWELPIHLLDAVFYATTSGRVSVQIGMGASAAANAVTAGSKTDKISGISSFGQQILQRIDCVLRAGIQGQFLQTSPHIVLLDTAWYHAKLKPVLAPWVLLWLRSKQHIQLTLDDKHALAYLTKGPAGEEVYLARLKEAGGTVPETIEVTHQTLQKKMLNLAADWLQSYAPHVLTKIDRVSYGLLLKEDMERVDKNTPASRKLMAVPFVGKDVPSHSSEFAQPDVLVGLSVLAYRYEGLRLSDIIEVVKQLQDSLREEVGPLSERPSARRFSRWIELGNARLRQEWARNQRKELLRRDQKTEKAALTLRRTLSEQERELKEMERKQSSQMINEDDAPVYNVNPLHIFQLSDHFQLGNLFKCVAKLPELIHYYLDQMVFPATLQHQETKISASGQELGGNLLFPRRLGFSGTPSDLLPIELGACGYEKGSEGSILETLVSPQVVSYELVAGEAQESSSEGKDEKVVAGATKNLDGVESWTVRGLLKKIATKRPPYNALIDTGALVTGMTNDQVATFLMQNGLSETMEACVFLDKEDRQMALLKGGKVIPLKQCGVELAKRFSFYDQVHTTGMDIKQAMNATAVVTLGKDMTHRDFSQGCYRMRGIGKGQTIHLFIIPEVLKLIRKEVPNSGCLQKDVNAWLLVNSMRSEKLQFMQLCIQNTSNVYRKKCHAKLVASTNVNEHKAMDQRRCWRFQEDFGDDMEAVRKSIMVFREKVDFSVRGKAVLEQRSFANVLDGMVQEYKDIIQGDQQALDTVEHIQMLASNAGNPMELSRQKSLNQEMVQEAEQEAQKQKEKQVEQEQQVQVRFSREDETHVPWPVLRFTETPKGLYKEDQKGLIAQTVQERHAFYMFQQFSLRGVGKSDLSVPSNMLLSHNYFRPEWASTGQRRLKNIVVVLEWQRPRAGSDSLKGKTLSEAKLKQLRRMFELLDFEDKGFIRIEDMAMIPRMLGEDCTTKELEKIRASVDPEGTGRIEFDAFQETVLVWSDGDSHQAHDTKVQKRFVCVSLCEAETIRRLIHANHPLLRVNNEHQVGIGLRLLQSGEIMDRSPRFVADISSAHADIQTALACFRFINCEYFYDETELLMLMRGLQLTKSVIRRAFFENALRCRRRDRQRYNDTPLAKVFASADHFHVLLNRATLLRMRARLLQKRVLLRDAFDILDTVGDGRLYETELWFGLGEGFLKLGLSDEEVSHIFTHCDKNNDGEISKYEFLEAICLEEDYKHDQDRFEKADFKQITSLVLPDNLKRLYIEEGERRKKRLASEREALEAMERRIAEEKKAFHFRPIFEALDRGQKGSITFEDIEIFLPSYKLEDFLAMAKAAGRPEAKSLDFKEFCSSGMGLAKQFLKASTHKTIEKKHAGTWNCTVCTLLNVDSSPKCTVCNAPKPAEVETEAPEIDDDVDMMAFEPPIWVCQFCTTRNEKQYEKCKVCSSSKPVRKKRQLVDALWECTSCTKQNSRYADRCVVCDTKKPKGKDAPTEK